MLHYFQVITNVGADNVVGLNSDNASAETTSWDVVRDVHTHVLCVGCTAHGASLLFKQVCTHTFATTILDKAITLAKFMRNHTWTRAEIKRRTTELGRALCIIIHGATRFAAVYYTMKRLGELKGVIRQIVVSDGFSERYCDEDVTEITTITDNAAFWTNMAKLRQFMKPLKVRFSFLLHFSFLYKYRYHKALIKLHDHDTPTTEHMYPGMVTVEEHWEENTIDVPTAFKNFALREHRTR